MEASVPWYRRLGPGLITAAVVLGPGSVVSASRAGAEAGYGLVWMLAASCLFMATFTSMAARVGCALPTSFLQYLAEHYGRPLAAVTGMSAFLVAAGFQFGNNIGVAVAMQGLVPGVPAVAWPIVFTVLSFALMMTAQNVYQLLERAMRAFVGIMLFAFILNLFFTGINPVGLVKGLVPSRFGEGQFIIATATLGTTFSAVAAFYQSYLVQAKGWKPETVRYAIQDAWIGIGLLGTLSLVITMGAAESLYGKGGTFTDAAQLAEQLRGVLGNAAVVVFSLGLGAAAFSSFIANALIGGTLLADGFGLDPRMEKNPTRLCAGAALLIGCGVAVTTLSTGLGGTTSVLVAQTSTLVASPLCALLLLFLANKRGLMGPLKNNWLSNLVGVAGLALVLYLAFQTLGKVWASLSAL
ncbi:MAG: divalent metal cation transporter [Candidatus Hydrogenedentes bacterium]|nr:divalent metal cation transporter [Candidatus Hydrogenedentota bacterium]